MAANKEHKTGNQNSGKTIKYDGPHDIIFQVRGFVESYLGLGLKFKIEDNGGIFFTFEHNKSQALLFERDLGIPVTVDPSDIPGASRYSFSVREIGNITFRKDPEKFQQLEDELKELYHEVNIRSQFQPITEIKGKERLISVIGHVISTIGESYRMIMHESGAAYFVLEYSKNSRRDIEAKLGSSVESIRKNSDVAFLYEGFGERDISLYMVNVLEVGTSYLGKNTKESAQLGEELNALRQEVGIQPNPNPNPNQEEPVAVKSNTQTRQRNMRAGIVEKQVKNEFKEEIIDVPKNCRQNGTTESAWVKKEEVREGNQVDDLKRCASI